MIKNLSIRWKLFLGFGIILFLLALVSIVTILSLTKITGNSKFVKETAFRQALYLIEVENLLTQLSGHIAASVDTGTGEGLSKAAKLKEELDKKWAEADAVFSEEKTTLKAFHDLKTKVDGFFKLGQDLVRLTVNQEWAGIGPATQNYNKSREEVKILVEKLKADGISQLDRSLLEIVNLTRKTVTAVSIVLVLAFLSGIFLTYRIGASIVNPLRRLTDVTSAIAGGDLTREVTVEGSDEIGALAKAFNHMTVSLKEMLKKINETFRSLDEMAVSMSRASQNISDGSNQTAGSVENVHHFVDDMNRTIQNIVASMEDFSNTTEEMSSWILEMTSSITELAHNAENLALSVNDTTSSIHEMSASITSVAKNVGSLLELQTSSSSSIMEINSSIREVESMTKTSSTLAEKVNSVVSDQGIHSVTKAVNGMLSVNAAVSRSAEIMKHLGNTIEDISRIVNVIDEIADQTKLLSLNAAILAAQAGEHGKGFSVVSDEISSLSENTIRSTKEIADLIHTITSGSKNAVQSMAEAARAADTGITLVKAVESVLNEINQAASSSYEIAKKISLNSIEQAKSSSFIIESIQDVTQMCEGINKATNEQSSGVNLMVEAAEKMKDISLVMRRTTEEQSTGSRKIAQGVDDSVVRSRDILDAIQKSNRDIEQLVNSIGEIQRISKGNLGAVLQMNSNVSVLSQQANLLKEELNKFSF